MKYIFLTILTFLVDRVTKIKAKEKLKNKEKKVIFKGNINLELYQNKGIILGHLRNKKELVMLLNIVSLVLTVAMFILGVFKFDTNKIFKSGISILLGGALGNVYDRIKQGSVTDFFSFKFKPNIIFNLADMFIFIGSIFIVISELFYKRWNV